MLLGYLTKLKLNNQQRTDITDRLDGKPTLYRGAMSVGSSRAKLIDETKGERICLVPVRLLTFPSIELQHER
jgi:hypothetical protein